MKNANKKSKHPTGGKFGIKALVRRVADLEKEVKELRKMAHFPGSNGALQ